MIDTNLICVDGLPGSGKSTTAQLLFIHLSRNGYNAEWFYEHQISHPIYKYYDLGKAFGMSPLESKRAHERALRNWKRLANSLRRTGRITILESPSSPPYYPQAESGDNLLLPARCCARLEEYSQSQRRVLRNVARQPNRKDTLWKETQGREF
jgi:hypothetical protein